MGKRTNNGVIVPCKNCTERFVGCHSVCLRYIDFQQRNDVERMKRFQNKEVYTALQEMHKHRCELRNRKGER